MLRTEAVRRVVGSPIHEHFPRCRDPRRRNPPRARVCDVSDVAVDVVDPARGAG